jgi:hypothetical protein
MVALQNALADYYRRAAQASNRMAAVQTLIRLELERQFSILGPLGEVKLEASIKGKHRPKNWDVTFSYARRPQLAVSTKAIMRNPGGTVPNRIDDAMGECVNVHAHDPGMVLGYLFVMDAAHGQRPTRNGRMWTDILADSLASFSGRRSERDANELFEAATLLVVDFSAEPPGIRFHPGLLGWQEFFDVLVGHVRARHPAIDLGMGRAGALKAGEV